MNTFSRTCCAALHILVVILFCSGAARASCENSPLRGVNLSGAEFGKVRPGVLFKDYAYPTRETLRYFSDAGMNVIRLPFLWERIQHAPFAPLDTRELAQMQQIVGWSKELNLCVILDLHNYGAYQGKKLDSPELNIEALGDVWVRLQRVFFDPHTVVLGLMNEPAALSGAQWVDAAQATVTTLRNAGARNWILVPSPRWSGAHEFEKPFAGASAAQYFATFKDPLEHYAIELHQYADENFSGTSVQCMDPERLRSVMARVGAWSRKHKVPLFLGEFGVANTPPCLDVLRTLLESMKDKDIWLGWTYWSAGAWWGPYPFSIQPPLATPERPIAAPAAQLMVLKPFLRGSTP